MQRFVLVPPFSLSCISESSVAVDSTNITTTQGGECSTTPKINNSFALSAALQRLITHIKNFAKLFACKEEMDTEMEMEMEMEIGYPTDVKHVTHIGLDGNSTTNPVKGWENLQSAPQLVSFPTISFKQFELAMAAQALAPTPFPLVSPQTGVVM